MKMKKNVIYMQMSILNEVLKEYNTRVVADRMLEALDKDGELSIYATHADGIVLRKMKEINIIDNDIISAITKALRSIIEEFEDIKDICQDIYGFEYQNGYINDGFVSSLVEIRRSGKLIYVEFDL